MMKTRNNKLQVLKFWNEVWVIQKKRVTWLVTLIKFSLYKQTANNIRISIKERQDRLSSAPMW